jgi:hypothetical protein
MVKPHPRVSYYGFFPNNDKDSHDPFTLPGLSEELFVFLITLGVCVDAKLMS